MKSSDRNGTGPETSFEADLAGIGALVDPVRRDLYRFVCAQPEPVGRDAAAEAVGIPRHQAKFHLDRLESDGLLVADYARLTGRSGPGAGRPAKVYRRADRDIAVSLPHRQYELAGQIMADAIDASMRSDVPIAEALRSTAVARGHALGEAARARTTPGTGDGGAGDGGGGSEAGRHGGEGDTPVDRVVAVLAEHGYEPRWDADRVIMANCPFHSLVATHTELVCTLNHALIAGLTDALAPGGVRATLDPGEGRCCVTLRQAPEGEVRR
ncbi:transcriptional regulator [Intrasporangium chromatireducens Q5-1]|uniref:Transcriptional regulator n=1 Tax=Intrasporangium chromatireducens Q5-1 TaxID=584657 RepID=W9GCJ7_9MICO|nr:helix-turn-helix domain-containing protein [Intrasporangium chromatireducens]EWT03810.1 transcriptional regulator [Intrasporangium chromatireducens Q5-1]